MPKLWDNSIDAHRRAVHDAIVESAAALVDEVGLRAVTMSQIAERAGIGRATLYKYFADVEAILVAWHEVRVTAHLEQMMRARDQAGDAGERLEAVLESFALIAYEHHGSELAALVHGEKHIEHAHGHLKELVQHLISEGARAGELRGDVAPAELASYCLHALSGASTLKSKAAARRLVTVTIAGLRPPALDR